MNFHTIALSALRRGEIAIGYRRQREDDPDERNLGGVTVNPNRTEMISFERKDMVIVLARD